MTETKMQLVDWLDDLCVRFIINLPGEELDSVERICFQIEEAQWFYEDFVRPLDPTLPSLSLRQFCLLMFQHCPIFAHFSAYHHMAAFAEFLAYKTRVPVRGAIMLNDAMDHVLMVRGWKSSATWTFPRGKINQNEKDIDCAIREAYEETGFDLRAAGLVEDESKSKHIEVTLREQHMMLFVFRGVPMDAAFIPQTRKEIGKIKWYKLTELPSFKKRTKQGPVGEGDEALASNKFYMVAPFLGPLKKWIAYQKKMDKKTLPLLQPHSMQEEDPATADETDAYLQEDREALLEALTVGANQKHDTAVPLQDVASDLKRMLSVGQGNLELPDPDASSARVSSNGYFARSQQGSDLRQAPTSSEEQTGLDSSNRLLGLLKQQESSSQKYDSQNIMPPLTPFDQIQLNAPMPHSPRRHQTRLSPVSSAEPPPLFPVSQVALHHPQNANQFPLQRANGENLSSGFENSLPATGHSIAPQPIFQPISMNDARSGLQFEQGIHQRVPDTQFLQSITDQDPRFNGAPHESHLPLPKLTNHALSMLNLFKSKDKVGVPEHQISLPAQTQLASQVQSRDQHIHSFHQSQSPMFSSPDISDISKRKISPQTLNQEIPKTSSPGLQAFKQVPLASPASQVQDNSQKDTLLNLFRTPSTRPNPQARGPIQGVSHMIPPVELAAVSTPGLHELQQPFPEQTKTNQKVVQNPQPKLQAAIDTSKALTSSGNSAPVSATVSGPLTEPDFGGMRRSQMKRPNRMDAKAEQPRSSPIQILKRPTSSNDLNTSVVSTPSLSSNATKAAAGTKTMTSKAFQPTILRRPQPSRNTEVSAKPGIELMPERPSQSIDQHKEVLLSLFNTPAATSTRKGSISPIISPSSVQSAAVPNDKTLLSVTDLDPATTLLSRPENSSRTRVSSLASITEAQRNSNASSPISPLDKSFLLGYLNNVVKNSGR